MDRRPEQSSGFLQRWGELVVFAAVLVVTIAALAIAVIRGDVFDGSGSDRPAVDCSIIGIGLVDDPDCESEPFWVDDYHPEQLP